MTERIKNMADSVLKEFFYPESKECIYDRMDLLLPERILQTKRVCDYMKSQDVHIPENAMFVGLLGFDKCPYPTDFSLKSGLCHTNEMWNTFSEDEKHIPIDNLKFFGYQHATPNFGKVIRIGIEGLKKEISESMEKFRDDCEKTEFLKACDMMCDGIVIWQKKCAKECKRAFELEKNPERKKQLEKMYENIKRIPLHPARNFYEALQCLYFCFDFMRDGIGLPDRWLYKFYQDDIKNGILTRENAKELLQECFIKIQGAFDYNLPNSRKGGQSHFSVGGYTVDGEDGYNELSDLIMESLMELPLYVPQISFRWTKKTPTDVLERIMDFERRDKNKRVAFANDEAKIKGLMNCGISWERAVDYSMTGCNLITLPGAMWYGCDSSNQAKPLTDTLYGRKKDILKAKTFDEFYEIYEEELHKTLKRAMEIDDLQNLSRAKDECILGSLFLDGCIENGVSLTKGGALGISELGGGAGLICTVDSLTVIRQLVFEEKLISMENLLEALENNWENHEEMRNLILNKTKFFGNDEEISDSIAQMVTTSTFEFAKDKTDVFGKHYLASTTPGYREYEKWFGAVSRATPDGRYDGTPFDCIGIGQTNGKDKNGLSALLNSVAKADPSKHFSGVTVTNINLDSSLIYDEDNFKKTVKLVETYFKNGGAQLQINSVSREDLINAKENPENYKNLRVRVSGFSAYFVELEKSLQDNIIARTQIH